MAQSIFARLPVKDSQPPSSGMLKAAFAQLSCGHSVPPCAKLTDREDGGEYLYSYHGWRVEVLS